MKKQTRKTIPRIVQIAVAPAAETGEEVYTRKLFALDEKGTLWEMLDGIDRHEGWTKVTKEVHSFST